VILIARFFIVSMQRYFTLSKLVADTDEAYIETAIRLGNSGEELSQLRHSLRTMFEQSGLCDGSVFARDVESAYRQAWQAWCATA
jgi:predicted O-linked N-acetylglucosamine transferase (SPINDLY family)